MRVMAEIVMVTAAWSQGSGQEGVAERLKFTLELLKTTFCCLPFS